MPAAASSLASTRARVLVRAWQTAAIGGVALLAAHALFGSGHLDDFYNRFWYNGLILLALSAAVVRVVTAESERGAWIAFAVALGSWAVAEVLFDFVYGGDPPYPSAADAFYIAFYPAAYVGVLLLIKYRISDFGRMLWFDGVMAATAAAAFGAAVVFEVVLRHTHGSNAVVITNLAYPLGDVLLLSAVIGVFTLTGWRPDRTWGLLGVALLTTAAADSAFLIQTAANTYHEGTILDTFWPLSMLLLAAALWQPSSRRSDVPLAERPLLATSAVCLVIGLVILSYDHFHRLNILAVGLACATLIAVMIRMALTYRENVRILGQMRSQAVTDALTGLGNRRRLIEDLSRALDGGATEPRLLSIYDLDGFKLYNDTYGHLAGDAMLTRLAGALADVVAPYGACYRLGGDEFCVLADVSPEKTDAFLAATTFALSESGEGFSVASSVGAVRFPREASTPTEVLRLADQRLYIQKRERSGRRGPHQMLLQALYERSPEIQGHVGEVVDLATQVGKAFGLHGEDLEELRLAARLHDVGKLSIPDAVVHKPGPLDDDEWSFIKEHTLIGERILAAAPGWRGVAEIVRATHERWDGSGYPDGLAGVDIPLAARIVAACDAFSAMTTRRPYRLPVGREQALAELRSCAGTQFDPDVVGALCAVVHQIDGAQERGAA